MNKIEPFENKQSAAERQSLMLRTAQRYGMDAGRFEQTLMATVIPNGKATREQVAALLIVAEKHGLNPFTKEIYAFPDKGGGIRPIVGVDGWVKLCTSHPQYDGMQFAYEEGEYEGKPAIIAITCRIFRKDCEHPTEVTEWLAECSRGTEPWSRWPRRMLRHKALIQCARIAFGFAGIHDPDEVERLQEAELIEEERAAEVVVEPEKPKAKAKHKDEPAALRDLLPKQDEQIELDLGPVAEMFEQESEGH